MSDLKIPRAGRFEQRREASQKIAVPFGEIYFVSTARA
jgi:hypothetical protein